MNALRGDAQGRTKDEVGIVRHIFLDFDANGTANVESLLKRRDLPNPNYLVSTSPDKWQVVWRVEGFSKEQAEELQRSLVRETGADPAATDCARVLLLPGFYNHKHARAHLVGAQKLTDEIYRPERFPQFPEGGRAQAARPARVKGTKVSKAGLSQSERDWAYAKRALARGESDETVIEANRKPSPDDKHNPQYYAELTVRKATESRRTEVSPPHGRSAEPER